MLRADLIYQPRLAADKAYRDKDKKYRDLTGNNNNIINHKKYLVALKNTVRLNGHNSPNIIIPTLAPNYNIKSVTITHKSVNSGFMRKSAFLYCDYCIKPHFIIVQFVQSYKVSQIR